jgi:hypothetical protein
MPFSIEAILDKSAGVKYARQRTVLDLPYSL